MRHASLAIAFIALTSGASIAAGQGASPAGRGLSTTLGLSKGAGALTCDFCSGESKGGFAGLLGVDGPFRRGVRLGVEGDWWMHSGDGSSRSVFGIAGVVQLHPSGSGPLFVRIGMGVGRFSASSDEEELRTTAMTGVIGLGYEVRVSARTTLVPYLNWLSGSAGTMRLNGAVVTPRSGFTLLQYGVAWRR